MSWDQYLDIMNEAIEEYNRQLGEDPVVCPNDGQPLENGPDGILWCRFDGWRNVTGREHR